MRTLKHLFLAAVLCGLPPMTSIAAPGDPVVAGLQTAPQIAYEFAIYYPEPPTQPPIKVLAERLAGMKSAPRRVDLLPSPLKEAVVMARFDKDVQTDYRPPSLDSLKYFARGLSREQAVALQGTRTALILRFAHPQQQAMSAYRTSLLLVEQLAKDTNGLLWDEETREMFAIDSWHKARLESWEGDMADVTQHTVIHAYRGEKLVRAITLGMRKFGLPDVVVNDFSWSHNGSMGSLINLLSQALLEGMRIEAGGRCNVNLHAIRHVARRQALEQSLLTKSTGIAKLDLTQGAQDAGDPDNRLVEIQFNQYPGPDRYARQSALLQSLFGGDDSITYTQHTKRLLAASEAARAKLPELQKAFARGLAPGEYLLVKAPFATPTGNQEWMWVEVAAWQGDAITGLLKNEPFNIPTLHGGQMVKVSQAQVFDYIRHFANGQQDGNTTGKILQEQEAKH